MGERAYNGGPGDRAPSRFTPEEAAVASEVLAERLGKVRGALEVASEEIGPASVQAPPERLGDWRASQSLVLAWEDGSETTLVLFDRKP